MAVRPSLFGVLLCLSSPAAGQIGSVEAPEVTVTVDDLRTPAWPAFTLLGVTPTDIAQPSTPRALAVALLSVVQERRTGLLPSDFALEVAPYWLFDHPDLGFDEYTQPGVLQSMAQSMTVSVAAGRAPTSFDESVSVEATDLAVGVRTTIVSGRTGSSFDRVTSRMRVAHTRGHVLVALQEALDPPDVALPPEMRQALEALQQTDVDLSPNQYAALLREIERALADGLTSDSSAVRLRNVLDRLDGENTATIRRLSLEMQRIHMRRVGLVLEVAGGAVVRASDGLQTTVIRSGAWMTSGVSGERATLIGLVRLLRDRPQNLAVDRTLIDVGLKGTVSAGSLNIGTEGLVRTERSSVRRSRPTWRLVATFDYRVSRDVSLSASFGKDYRDAGIRQRNVVVGILGVNFGFGDPAPTWC
jgi:hypothetical protein